MRSNSILAVMGAISAAAMLMLPPATYAATIFDVNFNGAGETVSQAPDTQAADPLPTVNNLPSSTSGSVTIENATSKTGFSTFGSGNFAYFALNPTGYDRLNFAPNTSNQKDQGVYTFTFDYRRDSTVTVQSSSFATDFTSTSSSDALARIAINNNGGGFTLYRNTTTSSPSNFGAFETDTNYTIQAVLVMDGTNSTVKFYAAKSGDSFTELGDGLASDSVTLDGGSLQDVRMYVKSNKAVGLGVDNVTLEYTAIPEPASGVMLLMAGLGMLGVRRRGKQHA